MCRTSEDYGLCFMISIQQFSKSCDLLVIVISLRAHFNSETLSVMLTYRSIAVFKDGFLYTVSQQSKLYELYSQII